MAGSLSERYPPPYPATVAKAPIRRRVAATPAAAAALAARMTGERASETINLAHHSLQPKQTDS